MVPTKSEEQGDEGELRTSSALQPNSENVDPIIVPLKSPAKSLFDGLEKNLLVTSRGKTAEAGSSVALTATSHSEFFDDETTLDRSSVWTNTRGQQGWKDLDPLCNTVTNVFNLLTCSPVAGINIQKTLSMRERGIPRRIAHRHHDFDTVTTENDTVDERTDEGTDFDSYDDTHTKDHTVGSSSSSESSVESSYMDGMHSYSAASEGDIQIRNLLRKKMEKIASQPRKEYGNMLDNPKWQQTYEFGDRSSRGGRKIGIPPPPPGGKRVSAQSQTVRVTRVTPKSRKRGFFNGN